MPIVTNHFLLNLRDVDSARAMQSINLSIHATAEHPALTFATDCILGNIGAPLDVERYHGDADVENLDPPLESPDIGGA